jgi:hypothetical protein
MIRTTLTPTHIARTARCLLVAGTLATALIGGGLQSPAAAHAANTRPAATSPVRPLVHGLVNSRLAAFRLGLLSANRGSFGKRPLMTTWH